MAKQRKDARSDEVRPHRGTKNTDDSGALKSLVVRIASNAGKEPKFVFDLEAFVDWLGAEGHSLSDHERWRWKNIASGSERIPKYVRRSDRARVKRAGRDGLSEDEARQHLYQAFRIYKTRGSTTYFPYRVREAARVLGLKSSSAKEKFAARTSGDVSLPDKTPASEGNIARGRATENFENASVRSVGKLPSRPKIWDYDFRGKPEGERDRTLIAFLDDVYGAYLPERANEMREYLRRKDPKLFSAIRAFGFDRLPEKFRMPSTREKVKARIARAASGGYEQMSPAERKSVRTATQRKLSPKN